MLACRLCSISQLTKASYYFSHHLYGYILMCALCVAVAICIDTDTYVTIANVL